MKEAINIHNYEAWLLDYMEDQLCEEDVLVLKKFIAAHPELEIDLDDMEPVSLEPEEISFSEKSSLHKNVPFISDERFVAYIENEATAEEKELIESAAKIDPVVRKELDLYKRTILVADTAVVFPDKSLLKREAKVIRFGATAYFRAAAALILLAALWFMFKVIPGGDSKGQALAFVNTSAQFPDRYVATVENKTKKNLFTTASNKENSLAEKKRDNRSKTEKDSAHNITPQVSFAVENNEALKKNGANETPVIAATKDTSRTTPAENHRAVSSPLAVSYGSDDEDLPANNKKSSFWEKAGRAFRKLNRLGVKQVDAKETLDKKEEQYVLSLGNFSIRKNKYNQ